MRNFRRYNSVNWPYFISTQTKDRVPYFQLQNLARIVIRHLAFYRDRGDFLLFGYVVMPDHLHLLLTPRQDTISDVMRNLKSYIAREVRQQLERPGEIWQESFHDRIARDEGSIEQFLQYIHYNPVEAGSCSEPEEYPHGSATWYSSGRGEIPIDLLNGSGLGPCPLEI